MITLELVGQQELTARFASMPAKLRAALTRKMNVITNEVRNYVVREKLSGQVLNKKSGNLQRSITPDVQSQESTIIGKVFSAGDVKYAAIHEFGGKTAAHEIVATKANALAFMMNGKMVFFKRINHPGSNMPERSFLRSSLKDETPYIKDQIQSAVNESVK